nr:MAG TPA: tape measure protein [Caudoviricetes sp.]
MTDVGNVNVTLGLNSEEFIKSFAKADDELQALEKRLKKSKQSFEEVSMAMAGAKNPSKELQNTYKKLKDELIQNQSAFDKFNNKLKKIDGGLTGGAKSTNLLSGALGKLATGGAILMATKQIIDFSKESVAAFRQQDRALKSLDTALQNAGVYTSEYSQHLRDLSSEIQSFSNYGDEAVEQALSLGQAYAGNVKLSDKLIKATVAYAAATKTDLETAFTLVGKSIGTSTNALARYGVSLDDNMSKEQKAAVIAETLGQRFEGSAQNMADSSVQLKNAVGDLSEAFGNWLDPAVSKTERLLTRLAQKFTSLINRIRIYDSEVTKLNYAELEQQLIMKEKEIAFTQKTNVNTARTKEYLAKLQEETKAIKAQMAVVKQNEAKKASVSKANYITPTVTKSTGTGTKSTKTTQDKALEEYKKYIEEYKKLNNDYAATLKARQYVEGTLNIDPLAQADEYNKLISVYTSYFAKITEISQSGAKNKGEILKLEERNLQQELQKIQVDKTRETQQKLYDIRKGYADEIEDIEIKQQAEDELGGFLGRYSTGYDERLQLLQWYYKERERITDMHNATMEEKQKAYDDLEQLNAIKAMEIQKNIWTQRGLEETSIFNNTLDSMLTNYGDFSANMQQLVMNLSRYFIKEIMQSMITQLSGFGNIESNIGNVFNSIFNSANRMSNSFVNMASSATVAQGATQAMVATQAVLAPLSSTISSTTAASSANYAVAAQGALQLAAAVAQLAVSEAAYSVAKIPMIGGFLAPVAATLTAAAISAGTAMVATTSKGAGLLTKGKSFLGGGGSASTLSSGIGPIARADYSESLPKYHSGGLVPGTKEQLAVLKGGERVLNPAESTSYGGGTDTGEGSVNNIMMFNIKAWDGKDVIKTLQANSQTINQIVSSGIKNNNQGLRTTVQNL